MQLIGVEEHWCPRELFEKEGTPGYESMLSVKNLFSAEQYEMACRSVSDIGDGRIQMMNKVHYLDETKFEPLLEAAEQLNAPLYIHPALPPQQIIDTYYHMYDKYAQKVLASGG